MNVNKKRFQENHKDLFKGYIFKLEGLEPHVQEEFTELITSLGGEIKDDDDVYILAAHNNIDYNDKRKMYRLCYILHCIREKKALDIEAHRVTKNIEVCEQCLTEFKNDFYSDEIDDIPLNERNENIKKNKSKSSKRSTIDFDKSSNSFKKYKPLDNDENEDQPPLTIKSNKNNTNNSKNIVMNPMASTSKPTNSKTHSKAMEVEVKEPDDSSDGFLSESSSDEQINIENIKEWWLPQKILKNQECQIRSCSLEPQPHLKHGNFTRNLTLEERRVIIKYLINTNSIAQAKGKKVFEQMHADGYLKNRSVETLRNCVRRRILPQIKYYQLPDNIRQEFELLNNH